MEYSYKFRLYPTVAQKEQMARNFGCCRYVYNHFLAQRQEEFRETGKSPTRFQQSKSLTELKQELSWLKEADSFSLQATLQDLDFAYQNFFRRVKRGEKPGYPKFKSKHNHRQSYKTKYANKNIEVSPGSIKLPKLGLVKCRVSKEVKGRILSATVSQNPSGKYFVSICCTDVEFEPLPKTCAAVGVDLGLHDFAITSDGNHTPNPKYLRQSEKKLARLQRQLSRKTKGSNRYEKARIKVARLHEHIANQRRDMSQKFSTDLIHNYDVICIIEKTFDSPGSMSVGCMSFLPEMIRSCGSISTIDCLNGRRKNGDASYWLDDMGRSWLGSWLESLDVPQINANEVEELL